MKNKKQKNQTKKKLKKKIIGIFYGSRCCCSYVATNTKEFSQATETKKKKKVFQTRLQWRRVDASQELRLVPAFRLRLLDSH